MLRQVSLENFKAFEKVTIDLGLITVLIGPNGTGKSSIAQALMLLKQSKGQVDLRLNGPYLFLGDYPDVVHTKGADSGELGEPRGDLAIELVTSVDEQIPKWVRSSSVRVVYAVRFAEPGRLQWQAASLWHNQDMLLKISRGQADESWSLSSGAKPIFEPGKELVCEIRWPNVVYPELRDYSVSGDERRVAYAEALLKIISSKVDHLPGVFLVPSIRGFDKPYYPLAQQPATDFLLGGPSVQASQIASTFLFRRDLEDRISKWFEDVVGLRLRSRLVPGGNVAIETTAAPRLNLINEGFGSNQLVHLLLQVATAGPDSLIAVEEPEIHLHPEAQARLVQILVKVAPRERKQFLIATHSEHVLMSFLNHVARRDLSPEQLCVYYLEKKEGESQVSRLGVNDKGQLSGGLRGFFEASLEQLEDYIRALATPR